MKSLLSHYRGLLYPSILVVLSTVLFSFRPHTTQGDCDPDALMENCAADLDDFVFVKSFEVAAKNENDKSNYSYVLSRDITYRIIACESTANKRCMVVNLYDRSHKLIASNQIPGTKKIFPLISYQCSATGVYYVEVTFENNKGGCGLNIIGFKK